MSLNELDSSVIDALKNNRKIEAIKLLKEKEGIGLKEAKHTVDKYLLEHPNLAPPDNGRIKRSNSGLSVLVVVLCFSYLAYHFFIKK